MLYADNTEYIIDTVSDASEVIRTRDDVNLGTIRPAAISTRYNPLSSISRRSPQLPGSS